MFAELADERIYCEYNKGIWRVKWRANYFVHESSYIDAPSEIGKGQKLALFPYNETFQNRQEL